MLLARMTQYLACNLGVDTHLESFQSVWSGLSITESSTSLHAGITEMERLRAMLERLGVQPR